MLPIHVLQPLVEFIVNAVITTQVMLDSASGEKKKKHVWINTANSIYNIADGFIGLPDGVDKWVKDEFIPHAIDKAVEYFKADSNESTFDKTNKVDVVAYVLDSAPKPPGASVPEKKKPAYQEDMQIESEFGSDEDFKNQTSNKKKKKNYSDQA